MLPPKRFKPCTISYGGISSGAGAEGAEEGEEKEEDCKWEEGELEITTSLATVVLRALCATRVSRSSLRKVYVWPYQVRNQ